MDSIKEIFLSIRLRIARSVSSIVPPHEVEDIVQETYVRLCQVAKPEQILYPKSYLFRTARNLALDSVKRGDNRLTEPLNEGQEEGVGNVISDADEVLEQAATSEEFDRLCEAVRLLPVQARRVFVLKKVYGYSQREIAAELGLAQSTVEKHIALAVRRCARYMSEQTSEVLTRPYRAEAHHE